MKYLVDSDYVADFLTGRQQVLPLFHNLVPDGISMSMITFAEIYEGIYYGQNRAVLEQGWRLVLRTTPVLSISRSIAKQYALMRRELARKGQLIDLPDHFIAATAIQHNLTLVTRNMKDYERIPYLDIYQAS